MSAAKQGGGNPAADSRKGKKDAKADSLTKHQRRAMANLHKQDDHPNTNTSKQKPKVLVSMDLKIPASPRQISAGSTRVHLTTESMGNDNTNFLQ